MVPGLSPYGLDLHMTERIIPLIMCGGSGTRLWPASREGRPKQFLSLFGGLSTFQETVRRGSDPTVFGRLVVITNGSYRFLVAEQLKRIGARPKAILLEPNGAQHADNDQSAGSLSPGVASLHTQIHDKEPDRTAMQTPWYLVQNAAPSAHPRSMQNASLGETRAGRRAQMQ